MSFNYHPLNHDVREIRVLVVTSPDSDVDTVSCRIRHISLDSQPVPDYETVSYFWGDATPCSQILLDGHVFPTPSNVPLALRRMSAGQQSRTLWIDAVCINQKDLKEREQQVALMGKVYSLGIRTLVYIGEADDLTQRAFANLAELQAEIEVEKGEYRSIRDMPWRRYMDPMKTSIDEDALLAFFSRPWFSRVWAMQEVTLASEAICLCGRFETTLFSILEIATFLLNFHCYHVSDRFHASKGLRGAMRMCSIADRYSREGSVNMFDLLDNIKWFFCSEARDKVFGILGMHNPPDDHKGEALRLLAPSYGKPIQKVFRDAVRYSMITTHIGLKWFEFISHHNEWDLQANGYPSWVQNLDQDFDSKLLPLELLAHTSIVDWESVDRELAISTADTDILLLKGFLLDEIATSSEVLDLATRDEVLKLDAWIAAASTMACEVNCSARSLPRTLTGDYTYQFTRISDVQCEGLTELRAHLQRCEHPGQIRNLPLDASESRRQACFYWKAMERASYQRRVVITRDGYLGLAPRLSQPGDVVVILDGNNHPSVLRPNEDHYLLLGNCYIDGAMSWQEEYISLKEKLDLTRKRIFDLR